ncbi:MAG: CoA transferase [Rhodobacterales bacterium]|nr:CoA transferase [Rhodobacterales bacterium]
MPTSALQGLRLLDLSHMLAGPYCAMLLADLGMDVIKVEPPGGEPTRRLLAEDPQWSLDGVGAYHMALARNKRSMVLNLKTTRGLQLFHELVKQSDVVLTTFSVGVVERLGIDHTTLSALNPRIITAAISGFGETGPHAKLVSFDMIAQAVGGAMSLTGDGETPLRSGLPHGDLGAGMMAAVGILAAVQQRHRTGRGQHLDLSMQDVQVSMLSYMAAMTTLGDSPPQTMGNAHPVHVPYQAYNTSDGWLVLAIIFEPFWPKLCEILNADDLKDPKYATRYGRQLHRDHIEARLRQIFESQPRDHWVSLLRGARIPCAPVNDVAQALSDPQTLARQMVVSINDGKGGTGRVAGNPIKLSDHTDDWRFAPLLGAHTDDVLQNLLGLSETECDLLRDEQITS